MGIVYAAVNPLFDEFIKIGRTDKTIKERFSALDVSVPKPFRCMHAIEVEDSKAIEKLMHEVFASARSNPKKEFFELDMSSVIAAMRLTGAKDVTPKEDDAEMAEEINDTFAKKEEENNRRMFSNVGVVNGDELIYVRDNSVRAVVVNDKKNKIKFTGHALKLNDGDLSLSKASEILIRKEGLGWESVNGWTWWMNKDFISMQRLAKRLEMGNSKEKSLFS